MTWRDRIFDICEKELAGQDDLQVIDELANIMACIVAGLAADVGKHSAYREEFVGKFIRHMKWAETTFKEHPEALEDL